MIPCRSKSQAQPPGADGLPPSYFADAQQTNQRLSFVWICSVAKSGQLPQLTPDASLSTQITEFLCANLELAQSLLVLLWLVFFSFESQCLTVASSFFLSPFTSHQLALFGLSALLFQELMILSLLSEYLGSGLLCSKKEIMTRGVGLAASISVALGLPAGVALMSSLAKHSSNLDRCDL